MYGDGEARQFVVEFPGGSSGEQGDLDNVLRSTDGAVVAEVVVEKRVKLIYLAWFSCRTPLTGKKN